MFYARINLLIPEQLYRGTKTENLGQLYISLAVYYEIIMQYSKASLLITHW